MNNIEILIMKRLLSLFLFSSLTIAGFSQILKLSNLRCEYKSDPLGVDADKPRLSWELLSEQQNVLQSAYRILVTDDLSLLKMSTGNIWDSKKVSANTSIQVQYNGKPLQPAKKYYWKVMAYHYTKPVWKYLR